MKVSRQIRLTCLFLLCHPISPGNLFLCVASFVRALLCQVYLLVSYYCISGFIYDVFLNPKATAWTRAITDN